MAQEEYQIPIFLINGQLDSGKTRFISDTIAMGQFAEAKNKLFIVLEHPEDMAQYVNSDLEVHEMLVDYLENRFLKSTLQNMKAHSLRLRWAAEYDNEDTQAVIIEDATREHLEIIYALEKQDEDEVYEAVKKHVKNSAERLIGANYVNYNQ